MAVLAAITQKEMAMKPFTSDTQFVESLDAAQREYFLGRLAGIQQSLQDMLRHLARGMGPLASLNGDFLALLPSDALAAQGLISVSATVYRVQSIPGSGRLKLSTFDDTPISMWDGTSSLPWVHPFEGFAAFKRARHADGAHKALIQWDKRRRGKA
ncbi:hypothetical protein C6N40_13300 [Arenimonas caeni]|uniref:Uncharacterized protein n=2 Tax=Arenimonas caeni TaxID=2058085 RepID=A0A2P6M5U3_9GAMM|nr:hypothetical protein C6N40_13300 [Arenimonas caeni]